MPKTIRYIGAEERFFEVGVTGNQQMWLRGQICEVSHVDGAKLLESGFFELVDQSVSVLESFQKTRLYSRIPIGSTSTAFGTAVNQIRYYVPFGGQTVQARLVYRNTNTSTEMVVADSAIASGRSFDDVNPLSLTGSAVPFVALGSGKTFPAAPSATVATIGRSDWMTVNVIEDAGRPGWGTIYVRNKFTSGGETWVYGGGAGQAEYNAAAPLFKSANDWQLSIAIGDNITVPTADYRRVFGIEIRSTSGRLATAAVFGDSRNSGYGTAGNQHGWASRACSDLNAAGIHVGFENWGLLNSVSSTFMDRLNARLDLGDCPDIVLWQPGSNNDTDAWTESVVTAQIARMIEAKDKVEALGGIFVPCTMFPSAGANTAAKVAQWHRLNRAARGCRYFVDFDIAPFNNGAAIPALPSSLTSDGTHINDEWQQFMAQVASALIGRLLGVN